MGINRESPANGNSALRGSGAVIRAACDRDIEAIREIYNYYVETSTATFDLKMQAPHDAVKWFEEHQSAGLPVLVAQEESVVGWASLSLFQSRCGYANTVEPSVYIRKDRHRLSLGYKLTDKLLTEAEKRHYHCLVANICSENESSINLIKKFGFKEAGILKEVGRKFDRWLDVTILQRVLE